MMKESTFIFRIKHFKETFHSYIKNLVVSKEDKITDGKGWLYGFSSIHKSRTYSIEKGKTSYIYTTKTTYFQTSLYHDILRVLQDSLTLAQVVKS